MARIHTMDDDITFERVRHLPKRTHVYSIHRKLSWECQKEIKLFEKDNKVTAYEMNRSQTFMKERLSELQTIRRQMTAKRLGILGRRKSCPPVIVHNQRSLIRGDADALNKGLSVKGIIVGTPKAGGTGSVKFSQSAEPTDNTVNSSKKPSSVPKRVLPISRSLSTPRKDPDFKNDVTGVPLASMVRRKTMPILQVRGNTEDENVSR